MMTTNNSQRTRPPTLSGLGIVTVCLMLVTAAESDATHSTCKPFSGHTGVDIYAEFVQISRILFSPLLPNITEVCVCAGRVPSTPTLSHFKRLQLLGRPTDFITKIFYKNVIGDASSESEAEFSRHFDKFFLSQTFWLDQTLWSSDSRNGEKGKKRLSICVESTFPKKRIIFWIEFKNSCF